MNNYVINKRTISIIGINKNKSKIVEIDREFEINQGQQEIIKNSCLYYGSSLLGRIEAANLIISNSYKVPIIIEKENNIIFFPTVSPNSHNCMWINIDYILKLEKNDHNNCNLILKNNSKLCTNLSYYTLENQMNKSFLLSSIMKDRKSD